MAGYWFGCCLGMAVAYNIDVIVLFIEKPYGHWSFAAAPIFIMNVVQNLQASDMVIIGLTSLMMSLLATLYPSWRASRLQLYRLCAMITNCSKT